MNELSDIARGEVLYRESLKKDISSDKFKNPIRYGVGNYLVPNREGIYRNSTLA